MATDTKKQDARKQMMLNQPVGRVIFKMAIPICLYMVKKIKNAQLESSAEAAQNEADHD